MPTKRLAVFLSLLPLLIAPRMVSAHPMGNFSVNHLSRIELGKERISIQYFIDLAEIPTFQELQQGNIQAHTDDPAVPSFIAAKGNELGGGLSLVVDGKVLSLKLKSSNVIFSPGAGGLPTMKMGFVFEADYPPGLDRLHVTLRFADHNYPGHSGWKEIIAQSSLGKLLDSSVPKTDRSSGLTNYPTDLLSTPPQDLEASLVAALPSLAPPTAPVQTRLSVNSAPAKSGGASAATKTRPIRFTPAPAAQSISPQQDSPAALPALALKANQQQTPRNRFTQLITAQDLSPWFLFTAAFIAMGLGALHALEPGHGKTIVAAYLVGSRGTARHAAMLGTIVTVSHTAGVFALGAITLYASRYIVPEQLYPWLGVVSGITIAGLGAYLFLRRLTGGASDHTHANGASHFDWIFSKLRKTEKTGTSRESATASTKPISWAQLFTLGITGGIIPCPAALIVLLSAFALHRIGLGFFLIVAFSAGLAAVLIGFGMLMVYARSFMTRLQIDGPLTTRWLPLASSAFILVLGFVLAAHAFSATHLNLFAHSKEKVGHLLLVTGLA